MPQLDPTWFASQLFWLAISIAVLFFILSRVVLPPLMAVLEARAQTRENDLALAQRLKTEADSAKQEYELALADAQLRAQSIFADAEQSNKNAADAAVRELDRTLNTRMHEAEKRIAESKQALLRGVEASTLSLVKMTVEKVTGQVVDDNHITRVLQSSSALKG